MDKCLITNAQGTPVDMPVDLKLHSLPDNDNIENCFTYHAPKPGQPEKYTQLRDEAKSLAYTIQYNCPMSRERSLALTKLEEAIFWANAAIARHE